MEEKKHRKMKEKKIKTEPVLLIAAIIALIAFSAIYLVINNSPSENPITTTTVPGIEQEVKYIAIDDLLSTLPESTENFEGGETHGAIQKITTDNEDGSTTSYDHSIVSKKYFRKSDNKEVLIVVTDSLSVDSLNGFFFNLMPLNTTWGYVQPKSVKGYPAWEHFEYVNEEASLEYTPEYGIPRVDVAPNKRVIVSINGGFKLSVEELYELANAVNYQQLEVLSAEFVSF